jgi:signal transduction histidine kinase
MFVRYISHEIRTPLNTVKMGLEMLSEDLSSYSIPTEIIGYVNQSKMACDNAIEVLSDLLILDKLETNTLLLEMVELNAVTLIRQTIQPFCVQVLFYVKLKYNSNICLYVKARRARIQLCLHIDSSELLNKVIILADEHKLAQVIRNLVSNGLKFTPTNGQVKITAQKEDGKERVSCLRMDVKDTGAGISEASYLASNFDW